MAREATGVSVAGVLVTAEFGFMAKREFPVPNVGRPNQEQFRKLSDSLAWQSLARSTVSPPSKMGGLSDAVAPALERYRTVLQSTAAYQEQMQKLSEAFSPALDRYKALVQSTAAYQEQSRQLNALVASLDIDSVLEQATQTGTAVVAPAELTREQARFLWGWWVYAVVWLICLQLIFQYTDAAGLLTLVFSVTCHDLARGAKNAAERNFDRMYP